MITNNQSKKILLWGAGGNAKYLLSTIEKGFPQYRDNRLFSIQGIIDFDVSKQGNKLCGYTIINPDPMRDKCFDAIVIMCVDYQGVKQYAQKIGYKSEVLVPIYYLLKMLLLCKYQDTDDHEIIKTLEYLNDHELSMYNNYLPNVTSIQRVKWDNTNRMPYVDFVDYEGILRKMYYPRDYSFEIIGDEKFVDTLQYEQEQNSPHRYCPDYHNVKYGDAIIDGGVCEGNFSLYYAGIASKIFLFESNPIWEEAHYYSFKDFKEKTLFCYKKLGNQNNSDEVMIDSVCANNVVDFLKLDIEGSEKDALLGARETLKRNRIKSSICTYHKSDDYINIKTFFLEQGYKVSASKGVVVFLWGSDIWEKLDFRKCMIYAEKEL